ncbi:MAG TPA: P1 family peptidase [Pyrinomonadaceae bacterium]|jgi:D-aminopeptidase|nr:P1 family peptidase [Pyrinomonadaceae bacterium]
MMLKKLFLALAFALVNVAPVNTQTGMQKNTRPRAREAGVRVGVLPAGALNAITDVAGVRVGHTTIVRGADIRTGVTAILPHAGNLFREKVAGAVFVGNGFGKLAGSTQVNELGEIETPILLTSTLSVPRVADALVEYMLALPGNENVRSVNPLVAETNDGGLNDIRGRHVAREDVQAAIKGAMGGAVEEGAVGAGTGTIAFGFKGGIGTSSRKLPSRLGGYTVGALVQTNYGGVLTINGAPVGRELGKFYLKEELEQAAGDASRRADGKEATGVADGVVSDAADGSIIIVIATDAPVDARNLRRMAARAMLGLGRTGASGSNGSGDYVIAFSNAAEVRVRAGGGDARPGEIFAPRELKLLSNDAMSPLFLAVIEATEEAIYNSLFRAQTTTGRGGLTVEALPLERTLEILRKYNALAPKP